VLRIERLTLGLSMTCDTLAPFLGSHVAVVLMLRWLLLLINTGTVFMSLTPECKLIILLLF